MTRPRSRFSTLTLIVIVFAGVGIGLGSWAAWRTRPPSHPIPQVQEDVPTPIDSTTEARIVAFCGDCHGVPHPRNFSRTGWRKEVLRGFEFYARSGRTDLDPPPIDQTIAYFQQRTDAKLVFPDAAEPAEELPVAFRTQTFSSPSAAHIPPAVAHLRWATLQANQGPVLLACDIRLGTVAALDLAAGLEQPTTLAQLSHPGHAEPCDLDADGFTDLVVAELGGLAAVEFNYGRVIWLRGQPDRKTLKPLVLASDLGRVSDVRPADTDNDGDLDLVVAEFGARTGRIFMLRNESTEPGNVRFVTEDIDWRPGTVHLPLLDLNRDGRTDFVALVSQVFESVDAFINVGNGRFELQTLWEASDPAFGSSGLSLADLDGDGDTDLLFTNGDSFDDKYVKPCHGVQWLENQGGLRFDYHRLCSLPGAYHARAGDIDLDGDLDVVATVWVEPRVKFANPNVTEWASLICLEQTSPGEFQRHTLETDFPWHSTMEVADFDSDGDLDVALGSHSRSSTVGLPYWLAVWWNQGRRGA